MALLFFCLVKSLQGFRGNIPAMTETLDTYAAGTEPDDFAEADLPDDITGEDTGPEAPWGWITDPDGTRRPKKSPGRPRKPPTAEELATGQPVERTPDQPPGKPTGRRITILPPPPPAGDEVPTPKAGFIAKGVNKLYRRTGKVIRGLENGSREGFGQAFIECTRIRKDEDEEEDERELTVGEAWENLARNNPRIRAIILRALVGGDIGDLIMAHAPIGVALVMKPWVQRFIHPGAMLESLAEPDEDEEEGTSLPAGLTMQDVRDMQDLTSEQAQQIARKMASGMGVHLSDADIERATRAAAEGIPPAFRRQQPKNRTRAQRTGASK